MKRKQRTSPHLDPREQSMGFFVSIDFNIDSINSPAILPR